MEHIHVTSLVIHICISDSHRASTKSQQGAHETEFENVQSKHDHYSACCLIAS